MVERICIITPYKELYELAVQCKAEMGLDFIVKMGNLEEAIPIAKKAEREGSEIIVSRGGTASIIRGHVNIPVVEIKITHLDILKSLYPFRDSSRNILIVGYSNVVYGCRTLSEILNINIKDITVPDDDRNFNWEEIQNKAQDIISQYDINTVVGDMVPVSRLGPIFSRTHLITSGKEAVSAALGEAVNIIEAKGMEKRRSKTFQAVLDFVSDGVLSVDENGLITVFNPSAEKIFGLKCEDVIGKPVKGIIKEEGTSRVLNTHAAELDQLQEVPGGHILTNRIPIRVGEDIKGVVATFQEISKIQGAEQKIRENIYSKGFVTKYSFKDILTRNPNMKRIIEMAKDYSLTGATILIEGESGTGKEVLAQSIHAESKRVNSPFVAVNCAALPPQLLESELFGYVEGAFTGAVKGGKMGLFEMAHKGSIFLDEIGDMDMGLQAKLLRVLEEKQVMRIGSDKLIPVDIRVIAATNVNLKEQVRFGNFRSDLFYRLNVLNLHTIPLRDRKDDIEYLSDYFIRSSNKKHGRQVEKLSPEIIEVFLGYSWPGNVREMKNVIERIVLTSRKDYINISDIELIINELREANDMQKLNSPPEEFLNGTLSEIKGRVILEILKQEGYNKSKAARRLSIDRSTLDRFL